MVVVGFNMGKTQKVIVCGSRGCGKTSILEKVIYDNNGPFSSTLEDVYVANIETDRGTREKIRFYDTQGVDVDYRDSAIPKHLLAAADGCIIVYSVDDWKSYQVAESIKKEIRSNADKKEMVVVILGTKTDLSNSRQVESVQALQWANNEKVRLCEVSALDRSSLYEPFMYLASKLNPPPNKSALSQLTSTIKRERNKSELD